MSVVVSKISIKRIFYSILKYNVCLLNAFTTIGAAIYDVHTEGGGGQAQVDACGRGRRGGPAPCGRPHRKLKLESTDRTDVILSSSHAKKLASFYQNFVFGQKKSGNFSALESYRVLRVQW